MKSRSIKNACYLFTLIPQVFFVIGAYVGIPWMSIAFFYLMLPVVRIFVGDDHSPPNKRPSRLLLMYLKSVPYVYCIGWVLLLPWTIWFLSTNHLSPISYVGFTLSLWLVSSLNTAIGHELIHSTSRFDRKLGSILDASVGYVHFMEEHLTHHARNGHHYDGDTAEPGTSVYAFALKRYFKSLRDAWEYEGARLRRAKLNWLQSRMLHRSVIPLVIGTAFYGFAGPVGLAIYLFQIVGAAFTIQAITYLQHWGLSEKKTPALADYGFTWEDGCWMQACVTLNHAFHAQHHLHVARPYYDLSMVKGGLQLPASYPVMFMAALFPGFFTRLMKHKLAEWIENHETGKMQEHRFDCIGAGKLAQALRKK